MGRSRYKVYEKGYPYFLTSSVVYGLPIFCIPKAAEVALTSLEFLQDEKNFRLHAYVIMGNHIHLIAQSDSLVSNISSFKSYTARRIIDHLRSHSHTRWLRKLREQKATFKSDRQYQLWQEGYHPKKINGDQMMIQKIAYIHNNPVKRGYVDKPEYWRYSSARNYENGSGLIRISPFKGRGE